MPRRYVNAWMLLLLLHIARGIHKKICGSKK